MSILADPFAFVKSLSNDRMGMQLPVFPPSFSIGRDASNNLCVMDDQAISRQHCIIHVVGSSLMIEDCSRNGTYVDGERVLSVRPLPIPSMVKVGHTNLAIVPNRPSEANVTSIIDTTGTGDSSSFIVPPTARLRMRTDAFFVVDVVNSTRLVREDGPYFAKLTLAMGRTLERLIQGEDERFRFLKCTGDGYFACFGTASAALKAAIDLAPTLSRHMPVTVQLSVALHWGPSTLADDGDRIGNNVHAVFSVENVRHQDAALEEEIATQQTTELMLMTEAFWAELDESERSLARPIGAFPLKGLDDASQIYRWYGATVAD